MLVGKTCNTSTSFLALPKRRWLPMLGTLSWHKSVSNSFGQGSFARNMPWEGRKLQRHGSLCTSPGDTLETWKASDK